ncbi:MAG: hypothetical protein H7123_09835 [Thermoleophilia bacterium]|nr:hypothetical protein [Thermoleophilia bacterium]
MQEFNTPSDLTLDQAGTADAADISSTGAPATAEMPVTGSTGTTSKLPLRHAVRDFVGLLAVVIVWSVLVAIVVR